MCPGEAQTPVVQFAGLTFFARSHPGELCGSNGLPLTPNSITIYGRAQFLKTIQHPHLCSYLTLIRGKHERTVVVSEYHADSLQGKTLSAEDVTRMGFQILSALDHLNGLGIVHRNLCPNNVLLDVHGHVRLFNYGLYYMTNRGVSVSFPIGHPKYTAPEVFLAGRTVITGPKADVWSLGIILAEAALGKSFWADIRLGQVMRKALSLVHCNGTVLERLAREHNCWETCQNLPDDLRELLEMCLKVNPRERPTPGQLLKHPAFAKCFTASSMSKNAAPELGLHELYHLWQLAGGEVQSELRKQGLVRTKAPILSLPALVLLEGNALGQARDTTLMLDFRVVSIPLDILYQRLSHIPPTSYLPLLETTSAIIGEPEPSDDAFLPLVIRERDTEYQFHRIVLFQRLLQCYPYKRAALIEQARRDIPPLYRGPIWAAILGVKGDIYRKYAAIDKDTPTHTDRQIEVDIPRCHQYDELLSSNEGHRKFKRVLKAWVVSHPQYVYWQGLDSLCAPFLYLHFNDEARAYACLSAFIPKYLHKFFLKDNSAVIQEYLTKFSQLIAFHDPELANHLHDIGFIPELFAIPWFLTMFSHVFPLHKILHLWDMLLLGTSAFPLFAGFAILQQLRDTLLASGFNECILLFSDLPEIDIEHCVTYSSKLFEKTPLSITYRQHALSNLDHEKHEHESSVSPDKDTSSNSSADLDMSSIAQSQLQKERCAQISARDLMYLLQHDREQTVVVDIRSTDEFNRGSITDSVSIPQTENPDADAPIRSRRGETIIVVGSKGPSASQFAEYLLTNGFPRVCTLHQGIQVLRNTDLLHVPGSIYR